jgi:hypothetical protein
MVFDSEEQRQALLNLLLQVPVQTDLRSITKPESLRPDPETAALLQAIADGEIAEPPEDPPED